jgi:hypothetical protein
LGLREADDLRAFDNRFWQQTVTATRWYRAGILSTLSRRLPNAELVLYPDAGHGGIFQYHEAFVKKALEFLES